MQKQKFTQASYAKLAKENPPEKTLDIYDETMHGLFLRITPAGKRNWFLRYGHRTAKLGPADIISPPQARDLSAKFLSELYTTGISPKDRIKKTITLGDLLAEYEQAAASKYIPQVIRRYFSLQMKLDKITILWAEKWRNEFIVAGHKTATGNHATSALKTLLNWGEERDLCEGSLRRLKKLPETDSKIIERYLTEDEEEKLRNALKSFDSVFQAFIITELNTGIRKTALISLKWSDINFDHNEIRLRADTAKSKKTSFVPMNSEAKRVLKNLPQNGEYVFFNPSSCSHYYDFKKPWEKLLKLAGIKNLRFHDLRHNVGSKLAMGGVDIYEIARILTHSDIKVTARYAHFSPEKKLQATELLAKKEDTEE